MSKRSGEWQTWVADSDGESLRLIAGLAGRPNWSPDGRLIASNCVEGPFEEREDICIASVGGGAVRKLMASPKVETLPIWSRNGQWIYFTTDRGGDGLSVWRVSADGDNLKRISPGPATGGWESPDGKYVFYFKSLGPPPPRGPHTLWRMPVEGGQETPILEGVYPMFFSIEKKGIYFLSLANPRSQAPDVLKLYRWDSGDTVVIGELPKRVQRYPTALSVSPDGRYILTVHHEITGSDIMMVEDFR
jgi:dipeptidyl aminopeptidase/acylaminoacyl peptidase